MKIKAVIIVLVSLALTACNQNKPSVQIPVVGDTIDAAAIAQDTMQQKSIEASYEYAQTVIVNPKLVYDVRAYGGPASHGEYCIIRRGADNKADTVVMAERFGVIVNAFTADLDSNGKEEVFVVMRKPIRGASSYISGFEFDNKGVPSVINFGAPKDFGSINYPEPGDSIHPSDTIYISGGALIKSTPHYKKNVLQYSLIQYYELKNKNVYQLIQSEL